MPYSSAAEAFFQRYQFAPGRVIYVDGTSGSDTTGTGDGSDPRPYATVARGAQDLRSGRNDVLYIRGTSHAENTRVTISNINGFAIIGNRLNWEAADSAIQQPTASADGGGSLIRYTLAGHGFNNGDLVVLYGGVGAGSTRPNGIAVIQNATASTFDVEPPEKDPSFSANMTEPFVIRSTMQISGCNNFLIQGIIFGSSSLLGNTGAALMIRDCGENRIVGCSFGLGMLAIAAGTSGASLINFGRRNLIEDCDFIPSNIQGVTDRRGVMPCMMIQGAGDFVVQGCNFFPTTFNSGFSEVGWQTVYPGLEGVIHIASNPVLGAAFLSNRFANKFGDPLGGTPPDYTSLFHLDDPAASGGLDRVFARGNWYQDTTTGEPVDVDDTEGMQDRESAAIIGQENVQTWGELVWRRRLQDAVFVPQSMGETVARLAYRGAIHIDVTNGASGSTIGVNGLPENPVDNVADARTLADALDLPVYEVTGAITITTDHLSWTFRGTNPNVDIVTIDAGADVANSGFERVGVRGSFAGTSGDEVNGTQCIVGTQAGTVSELYGLWIETNFLGTITIKTGEELGLLRPASTNILGTTFDFDSGPGPSRLLLGDAAGIFRISNMNQATHVLGVTLSGGQLTLNASVTRGIVQLGGYGQVIDNKGAGEALFVSFANGVIGRMEVTVEIDQATDPWQEVVTEPDGNERARFELYDQDGNAVNNANPLGGVTFVGERRRLVD